MARDTNWPEEAVRSELDQWDLPEGSFDVIILGTGLTQCILSA